jgi:hypothetical protein
MKHTLLTLSLLGCLLVASTLNAAVAKSYQVTGPVLSISDNTVVVQKGDEKWEIAADKTTLGTAKVGDKVTIMYQMVAKKVDVKPTTTTAKPVAATPAAAK